ncbi:GvpL/GvpF family gas vesicle protein [Streptomyces sp. NPDC095602]|uniref:GvpL/GvpF family gas vesicle protein n=1 Tax=Streptomyces sp. NPDC095602 TaxID=3155819 RepID=UPI0033170C68
MRAELSYAYAVVRPSPGLRQDVSDAVTGVAGGPARLVGAGRVAAVVSSVPAADFAEEALKARLEDLEWLEAVARAHHGVVEALAAHTTVLPLRLATVYLDDDRVREALIRGEPDFAALLDRLSGCVEWGVKVYAERPGSGAAGGGAPGAESAPGGAGEVPDPGRAYLRRRRQQHQARESTWAAAADAVRRIEAGAEAVAVRHARHRPQQGRLAEAGAGGAAPGENVANDAYLVPREDSAEFRERVLRAVEGVPGVRVEITGPWAPYSFATLGAPGVGGEREEVPRR